MRVRKTDHNFGIYNKKIKKFIEYEFDNHHFGLYIEPMVMLDNHFFQLFLNIEPKKIPKVKKSKKEVFVLLECLML
jgi:hypothetical protein